jgi:hypothetical protein
MKPLARRTFLRGTGVAMSLPLLESMLSREAVAAPEKAKIPLRYGFIYMPCGVIVKDFFPTGQGENFELNKSMQPLEKHKGDLFIPTKLAHDKARANGDGAGDHARDSATFLTGCQAKKTGGADIYLGTSIDQVLAAERGSATRLPSLEIGIEPGRQAGACDSGYSCAYQGTISWKSPTQPIPKEIVPKLAFERLFGASADPAQIAKNKYRKSILDLVADDAKRIQDKVGVEDQRKLDEYFTSVREVEERISKSGQGDPALSPDFNLPAGMPKDYVEHIRLMYDIMFLAYQTDATRIVSYMLGNSGSNRRFTHLGVKEGYHEISHHRDNQDKVANLQKIDVFLLEELARFLDKMKSVKEADKTLLDNSVIVYGSSISDANRHRHEELPVILAGKAGGKIKTGRTVECPKDTPMSNLFLSLAGFSGIKLDRFGDSTGKLEGLT